MVLAVNLNFTIRDQKGKEARSVIRIPSTLSIAQYVEFGQAALQVVANASTGQLIDASISIGLDLSGGALNTVVSTFADVAEKALFVFRSSVSGLFAKFKIPTMDETNIVSAGTDQLDEAHADLAPFIAAIEDGITITGAVVVQPQDKYGNDVEQLQTDREIFQRHNR